MNETKLTTQWEQINVEGTFPVGSYIKLKYTVSNTIFGLKTATWSKEQGPIPPAILPIKLANIKGSFLKVQLFLQANKDKKSPIIKGISAKGKSVVNN